MNYEVLNNVLSNYPYITLFSWYSVITFAMVTYIYLTDEVRKQNKLQLQKCSCI